MGSLQGFLSRGREIDLHGGKGNPKCNGDWGVKVRHPTDETYLPLSRGIRDHLPKMVKECRLARYVYDLLLIDAHHTGELRGKVAISIREIATFLGVHYQTAYDAVRWLKENRYITYEPAKNQNSATLFTIVKYKTVHDFPPPGAFSRGTKGSLKAPLKRPKNESARDSDINELQDPNNSKERKDIYSPEIEEIIEHLNTLTNSHYRPTTKETISIISERLSEGHSVEDCKAVINNRWERWRDDPKMREFVRPGTLFRPSKFEGYLQEARRSEADFEWETMPDAES